MKRCINCGWDNHDNSQKCEKCHSKLSDIPNTQTTKSANENLNLKKTAKANSLNADPWDQPTSGSQKEDKSKPSTPEYDETLAYTDNNDVKNRKPNKEGTIGPDQYYSFDQKQFMLLSEHGDKEAKLIYKSPEFSENLVLNRDNLAPGNNTITSKKQASIQFKDGKWLLEDLSELKTTLKQLSEPTEIKPGDILQFGNLRVKFMPVDIK